MPNYRRAGVRIWRDAGSQRPSLTVNVFRSRPPSGCLKNLPAVQETRVLSLGREDQWRRKWQATRLSLSGKSRGQRRLVGCSPWGRKELGRTEQLTGEGDGTPLQFSCLENPMDGGAWWAADHGVAEGWTRPRDFTFTHWRRKWQPTPVFLPGESQGWGSLVGGRLWGRAESDTTEAT